MSHSSTSTHPNPLASLAVPPDQVGPRFDLIFRTMLAESPRIRDPQFEAIDTADLARLFELYDHHFFGGLLSALLTQRQVPPVQFRLSNRMTRAAGKTVQKRVRQRAGWRVAESFEYEIAVSTYLLFQAFRTEPGSDQPPARAVEVAGVVCSNRLEALLRICEHELLHLAEFLVYQRSSCAAAPFRQLSRRLFGHEASVHTLVTPVERAVVVYAISRGDRVAFTHAGRERTGVVNRITKRATVLVADPSGRTYSDGGCYLTYLVPLGRLRKV